MLGIWQDEKQLGYICNYICLFMYSHQEQSVLQDKPVTNDQLIEKIVFSDQTEEIVCFVSLSHNENTMSPRNSLFDK